MSEKISRSQASQRVKAISSKLPPKPLALALNLALALPNAASPERKVFPSPTFREGQEKNYNAKYARYAKISPFAYLAYFAL